MAIFFGTQGSITLDGVQSKNITEWSLSTSADVEQIKTIGNFTIFDEKPLDILEGSLSIITDDTAFISKLFGNVATQADTPDTGDVTTTVTLGTQRIKFDAEFTYTDADGNQVKISCVDCIATDHEFSNEAEGIFEETFSFNVKPENVTITHVKKATP
ncbi:MAG: hypothetical protein JW779_15780 [Candidatus Thorarchaeota archaeon]|nr:hypothetical protein [Candidatus Thorarchaeota archaeon]MBN2884138.1 hypothetical protein [Clostridia bacterium]